MDSKILIPGTGKSIVGTEKLIVDTQGKVTVYDQRTGQPMKRWPVDARTLVNIGNGRWGLTPPIPTEVGVHIDPIVQAEIDSIAKTEQDKPSIDPHQRRGKARAAAPSVLPTA
jgi:hypothetical protein